jgi:hypothetical protein
MKRRDFIIGGVVAMPLAAQAQERARPTIAFLNSRPPPEPEGLVETFR